MVDTAAHRWWLTNSPRWGKVRPRFRGTGRPRYAGDWLGRSVKERDSFERFITIEKYVRRYEGGRERVKFRYKAKLYYFFKI